MAPRLRSCALLAAGALGLHQLRYAFGYGAGAEDALRAQGHAYLGPVTAVVLVATIIALAMALHRVASGAAAASRGQRLLRLWAGAAGALLTIFAVQESIEGIVAAGHPGGLGALVDHGGWTALPLAAAIGLAIALLLRGARTAAHAARAVARRLAPRVSLRAPLALVPPPAPVRSRRPVLVAVAAGRGPPRAS
jgi:hypothetical protein